MLKKRKKRKRATSFRTPKSKHEIKREQMSIDYHFTCVVSSPHLFNSRRIVYTAALLNDTFCFCYF